MAHELASLGLRPIPVMRPRVPTLEAVAPRLARMDASGWFTNLGPQERELRERFARRLGVDPAQVATVANATLGIAGAIAVLGGERWLAPAFTFPGTLAGIELAGARLVLCDVDADGWALVPGDEEVDGLVPVAPFGARPDVARWAGVRRVVHDAAASIGALGPLDLVGLPDGHAIVLSLHATKVLGAGEGGVVVFGDAAVAERFRAWTNFGFDGSRESSLAGANAKMSEIAACYAHAALDGWERERTEWAAARQLITEACADAGVRLHRASADGIDPYAVLVFDGDAEAVSVAEHLARQGVETRRWWASGCHRMPAYRDRCTRSFPVTEVVAGRTLGIPFFRGITDEEVSRIRAALLSVPVPA